RRVPAQAGRTWPGPTGPCVALPPCRRPEQPIRTRQCTADILSHQCRHPQWRWAATFGASPELHECATRSSVFTCRKSPYSSRTTPAKYLTYREKSALVVVGEAIGSGGQGGRAGGSGLVPQPLQHVRRKILGTRQLSAPARGIRRRLVLTPPATPRHPVRPSAHAGTTL